MKAFVQFKYDIPYNSAMYDALCGLEDLGYEVIPYRFEDILAGTLPLDDSSPLVGTVASVHAALRQLGKPIPKNFDIPVELYHPGYMGREIWGSTLGEVRKTVIDGNFQPFHMKPLRRHKLFTGYVVSAYKDLLVTTDFEDDVDVLCSSVVTFHSEWRAFVLAGEILDCRPYLGDSFIGPNRGVLGGMIVCWTSAPVAYSLDVGMVYHESTDRYSTYLIEANDSYALGNYGLEPIKYARMIEARWKELMS